MVREHKSDRDRSDRAPAPKRDRRDREGSTSSRDRDRDFSREGREGRETRGDRDRPAREEASSKPSKKLRNEGESRQQSVTISSKSAPEPPPPPKASSSRVTVAAPSTTKAVAAPSTARAAPAAPPPVEQSAESVSALLGKKELYDKITDFETKQAKALKTSDGVAKCQALCEGLQQNLQELMIIKTTTDDPDLIEDKVEEGLMKIMGLRNLNRIMKIKLKTVKDDLVGMRSEVDADHLLLQNLLYEATNLQKQVAAVQDYKGMDEQIDLIPVTQFYEEAPESISKPEITKNDPHLLRIARLEYEFIQRQKLTEDCNLLEKEKELTSKAIEEKQAKLESIKPMLTTVLDATRPIQDFFGIDISAKKERNATSKYLPTELYILFVQSNAFKESGVGGHRNEFFINLCGNLEEAKEIVITPDVAEEDSDSDKEQDPDAEVSERRRLLRKKSSIYMSPDETKKKLVQKHPLWIQWVIKDKGDDVIVIQFFYLIKLKIVTVKVKVVPNLSIPKDFGSEQIGTSDNLLIDLFPDDAGLESPNPTNVFMFQKVDAKGISDFLNETGRPFIWAQKLAGLEFPMFTYGKDMDKYEHFVVKPKPSVSVCSIEMTLKAIRKRFVNQTTLWNQLKFLETKNIQIPTVAKELFPSKSSTIFKSWESITFGQFVAYDFTTDLLRTESVSEKQMFYKATLERGRATIIALVALSLDFPRVPPVFCVQLELDGHRRNARNDPALRDLEKEVNMHSLSEFEEWAEILVNLQIQRLIQCVDIILETDFILGESAGPSEFGRDKLFLRAATGRNSRRPFKYFGTGGGYFSQRY